MTFRQRLTCENNWNNFNDSATQSSLYNLACFFSYIFFCSSNRLIGLEEELNEIAMTQGKNVKEIIELVNENEVVLDQMKESLRQTFVTAVAKRMAI